MTMKRHVTCFVEKAGFEPRTLGTNAERYDHCAARPVMVLVKQDVSQNERMKHKIIYSKFCTNTELAAADSCAPLARGTDWTAAILHDIGEAWLSRAGTAPILPWIYFRTLIQNFLELCQSVWNENESN
jgi:hypothetical protein